MFQIRHIFAALLIHILFLSSFSHANFDKAMEVYRSGDFDEAKTAFEALAAIGDRSSLFNLGVMYYRGEAVKRDPVKAYVLMKIANDDLGEESYAKTTALISKHFNENQKGEVEKLFNRLNPIYNIK